MKFLNILANHLPVFLRLDLKNRNQTSKQTTNVLLKVGNAPRRFIVKKKKKKKKKTVCNNKVYDSEIRLAVSFSLLEAKNDVLEKFCTNTLNSD